MIDSNINCHKITMLIICDNKFINLYLICNLFPNLIVLNISNNEIENIDSIVKLNELQILNLSYNNINNINCIKLLKNLNNLCEVNLSSNKFKIETDEDVNTLNLCNNNCSFYLYNIYYDSKIIQKINNRYTLIYFSVLYKIYQDNLNHPLVKSYSIEELFNNNNIYHTLLEDLMETDKFNKCDKYNNMANYIKFISNKSNYNERIILN
jgi:hypothetical protein